MILNSAQFTFTAGWEEYLMMVLYFLVLIGIGIYAYKQSTANLDEYMLGGRNIGPYVTALSAGASDMSGWMLMGLPGAMYATGLASGWIAIGLTFGAYINYFVVAPKLRVYSEVANNSITIPDFLENRFEDTKGTLKIISGIVIVLFFTVYTASGMVSGGKLFDSAFGLNYYWGLLITAGVVVIYTFFGGYLAVSLTDFFQGTVMFIALIVVPVVAFTELGGMEAFDTIRSIDETKMDIFKGTAVVGIISNLAWGLGYFGQPHIIVRFMSIRSVKDIPTARRFGIAWMAIAIVGACFTGLLGIAFIDQTKHNVEDPETILILMSQVLTHPLIGGFFLAAILAAIMSTISSQLLVTSSSLIQDFYQMFRNKTGRNDHIEQEKLDDHLVLMSRLSVVLVAAIAIIIAWDPNSSVLDIVANAWAGFGAAFGPIMILALNWKRFNRQGAIAGMIVGALTVVVWIVAGGFGTDLYEIVPGFILAMIAAIVTTLMTPEPSERMVEQFDESRRLLRDYK